MPHGEGLSCKNAVAGHERPMQRGRDCFALFQVSVCFRSHRATLRGPSPWFANSRVFSIFFTHKQSLCMKGKCRDDNRRASDWF